jgi:hypothetical protein
MLGFSALNLETSTGSPTDHLQNRDFMEGLLKAGSLISMLEGKKINVTALFVLLLERKDYQDFFVEVTSSSSFEEAVLSLLILHPSLVKSKITKSSIRKLHAKKRGH